MTPRQKNWLFLILVPLAPVIALYAIFSQLNFFGLQDTWKGVVATGPIAAYVFMVWLGWGIFQRLDKREIPSDILGEWEYVTLHADRSKPDRRGIFHIQLREDDLQISGDYSDDTSLLGTVHSRFVAWRSSYLYFSYSVKVPRPEGTDVADGLCELVYLSATNELVGTWYRLHSTSAGTIKMRQRRRIDYQKEPNKAPEPRLGVATSHQTSETVNNIATVRHL